MSGGEELVKITDIAKETPYTAEYLSLRARQGKLKSQKIGSIWYSTRADINEYRNGQEARQALAHGQWPIGNGHGRNDHKNVVSHSRSSTSRTPWLIKWVAIPLSLVILFGFIPLHILYKSALVSLAVLNDLSDESRASTLLAIQPNQDINIPSILTNFATYSRTLLLAISEPASELFVKFYQNHPTILAASRSNFRDLEKQISHKYGSTSETSIDFVRSITRVGVENFSPLLTRPPGRVAGLKTETKDVSGHSGLISMSAGEQSIMLRFNRPVSQLIFLPLDFPDLRQSIKRIDNQTFEIKLSKFLIEPVQFYWSVDYQDL